MAGFFIIILALVLLFFIGKYFFRHFVDKTTSKNLKQLLTILGICFLLLIVIAIIIAVSAK